MTGVDWLPRVTTTTARVKRISPSKWLFIARCRRPVRVDIWPRGRRGRGGWRCSRRQAPGSRGWRRGELHGLQEAREGEGGQFGGHAGASFCPAADGVGDRRRSRVVGNQSRQAASACGHAGEGAEAGQSRLRPRASGARIERSCRSLRLARRCQVELQVVFVRRRARAAAAVVLHQEHVGRAGGVVVDHGSAPEGRVDRAVARAGWAEEGGGGEGLACAVDRARGVRSGARSACGRRREAKAR